VASLFAILLTERGINGGDSIKALVFLTIISTVFVQGLSARWVAQILGITLKQATGAVIVGCNPLSILIARLFRERGESVVIIDTDAEACEAAEQQGFKVITSSALDVKVLEEAGLGSTGTFIVMTNNGEVNLVLAQRAVEEFQPARVLAVFAEDSQATVNSNTKIQQAFAPEVPLKTWNRYLDDKAVKLGETTLKDSGLLFQQAHLKALIRAGELIPILMERDDRLLIAPANEEWQPGDRIIYLLHDPRPKLLRQLAGGNNQNDLVLEKLPRVEEIPIAAIAVEASEGIS
jgi:Trk K+ transport system NAD-binding subunit